MGLLVEPLAVHFDGRCHGHALGDGTQEIGQDRIDGGPRGPGAGLAQVTGTIACVRGSAELQRANVFLGQVDEEARQFGRSTHQDDEQARGEGIERARVAHLLDAGAQDAADSCHDVVRGEARRLVYQEDAVCRRAPSTELSHATTS